MNLFNYMIMYFLMFMSLFIMFIENNFLKWIILESYSLMFIFFINMKNKYKISSMNYFIISSISGIILMFSISSILNINNSFFMNLNFLNLILLSMMMKLGIFPFHMWMINNFNFMSWIEIFWLSTFTKIISLEMLNKFIYFSWFMYMLLIMNSLLSTFMALKENSLKKIIGFSSMNHTTYMIYIYILDSMYMMYYIIYMLNMLILMNMFNKMKFFNKYTYMNFKNKKSILLILMMIFIFSMLPPMLSFSMKWYFFFNMNFYSMLYFMLLIFSSIMIIWSYLNIMNVYFNKNKFKMNFYSMNFINLNIYNIWIISFMLNFMFIIMILLI